ncbi:MAG: hypothetical protein JNL08_02160 [Planctomycetes bacterium]|nr:hypothetical protein [Planctomycetota bacterium]
MNPLRTVVVGACLLAAAAAQETSQPAPPELQRAQRLLQQNRSEVDRLLEMRLRHDLGLPVDGDGAEFRPATPPSSEDVERSRQELRDLDAATAGLLERYNKLKAEADRLHAEAEAQAQAQRQEREFVVVPPANSARPRPLAPDATLPFAAIESPAAPAGEGAPAAPTAKATPPAVPTVVDAELDPIRGQIQGSSDHQRVAQSLFKAGQALMDRARTAREQGQGDAAKELDARARERFERAIAELEPLLAAPEPPFAALFYLGRSRELLFRLAQRYDGLSLGNSTGDYQRREQEVRDPFLKITARDVQKSGERGEIEVLGIWGKAAQSAMEHFRWMNLHGGYDPRAAIEGLTWPGEQKR